VVGSKAKKRKREREGATDEASLLFSSLSYNTVHTVDLQPRWIIQQPWAASTTTGSQFM
jgi:hypothetical protein